MDIYVIRDLCTKHVMVSKFNIFGQVEIVKFHRNINIFHSNILMKYLEANIKFSTKLFN